MKDTTINIKEKMFTSAGISTILIYLSRMFRFFIYSLFDNIILGYIEFPSVFLFSTMSCQRDVFPLFSFFRSFDLTNFEQLNYLFREKYFLNALKTAKER